MASAQILQTDAFEVRP